MKHEKFTRPSELLLDSKPLAPVALGRCAEGAVANVASRPEMHDQFLDCTIEFLAAFESGDSTKLEASFTKLRTDTTCGTLADREVRDRMRSSAQRIDEVPFQRLERLHYLPPEHFAGPTCHQTYLSELLARTGNQHAQAQIVALLGAQVDAHSADLDELRATNRQAYRDLIQAKCGSFLTPYDSGKQGRLTAECAIGLAQSHAIFLCAATSHLRTDLLRQHATNPLRGYRGPKSWPLMGSTCTAVLVEPARAIHWLTSLRVAPEVSDERAIALLTAAGFLENAESGRTLVDLANKALAGAKRRGVAPADVNAVREYINRISAPVSKLTRSDMIDAGWSRRDFTTDRIGVTASEGSAIIARELLLCPQRVATCIKAVLAGADLPTFRTSTDHLPVAIDHQAPLTYVLRGEGRTDKNAKVLDESADLGANNSSEKLVRNVNEQLRNPALAKDALDVLHIDPSFWFQR